MPAAARSDPATQRVRTNARRILSRPKLAMYLVDMQFPDSANAPQVLRLLQAVVGVAIRFPDEPNVGALLEEFRETEFASEVSRLLTDRDSELDAVVTDEEAEAELRELRVQIEGGQLFPASRIVAVPEHLLNMGILALGARRGSGLPPPIATHSKPSPVTPPPAAPSVPAAPPPRETDEPAAPDDDFDDIPFDPTTFAPPPDDDHNAPF